MAGRSDSRVLVIGLDSAPPALVFDELRDRLPNLSGLMRDGVWGPLRSCVPAITVPAWMTGYTSKDPGQLGIYGFRNRVDHSYTALAMADSSRVTEPTVWDILARYGKQSVTVGIPPAFPPRPIRDYYRYVDGLLGGILEHVDERTTLLVASDHGAKKMEGGICLNEWLIERGYLVLKQRPTSVTPFSKLDVDWARTVAWGE